MLMGSSPTFSRRPSTAAFMLRAFYPPALRRKGPFPSLRATWRGHRADRGLLREFLGLAAPGSRGSLPLLTPHVFGFPLVMVILTHPAFPVPIWRVLQVRNHLLRHRSFPEDAALDLETRVAGQRILEKGAEVDIHTEAREGGSLAWESLNTFYYRGRFGEPGPASDLAAVPQVGEEVVASWSTPPSAGWLLGRMTGDLNPLHWSSRYSRLLGFGGAFHHPQLVLGQALARLAAPAEAPQRLDAWLKGPVYHGSRVTLRATPEPGGSAFALVADGDPRPAIVGRWRAVPPGTRLSGSDPSAGSRP